MKFKLGRHLWIFKHRVLQDGVVGVRSNCGKSENAKHVFFMDMDNVNIMFLEKKIPELQEKFKMSDIFVIQSSESSYHLIELKPRTFGEVVDIQRELGRSLAEKYLLFAIHRGYWVLRCTPKQKGMSPRCVKIFPGDETHRHEVAGSHLKYLNLHFGVKSDLRQNDSHYELAFDKYSTVKKKEKSIKVLETKNSVEFD